MSTSDTTLHVRLYRWVDLIDRSGWTFLQTFAATLIVLGFDEWEDTLKAAAIAGVFAVLKTIVAQNVGKSPLGDAVPGVSTVEPTDAATRPVRRRPHRRRTAP